MHILRELHVDRRLLALLKFAIAVVFYKLAKLALGYWFDSDGINAFQLQVLLLLSASTLLAVVGLEFARAKSRRMLAIFGLLSIAILCDRALGLISELPPGTVFDWDMSRARVLPLRNAFGIVSLASTLTLFLDGIYCVMHGERNRVHSFVAELARGTSRLVGEDFLDGLAHSLSRTLKTNYVLVTELTSGTNDQYQVVASHGDGASQFAKQLLADPSGSRELFQFPLMATVTGTDDPTESSHGKYGHMNAFTVPLRARSGELLGCLSLVDDTELRLDSDQTSVIQIFASRAAAEIERHRADLQHRQLYDKIMQSQKLDSLGLLAGGLAHDFNNLMTGIAMHSEAALRRELDSASRTDLLCIRDTAHHASGLCNQLLAFAGRAPIGHSTFVLDDVIASTVALLDHVLPNGAIVHTPHATPLELCGDPSQVGQILLNLITNSAQAIGEKGGTIRICTQAVAGRDLEASAYIPNISAGRDYALIEVSDDGCGMSETELKCIFDPFYSTKDGGHGLGLAALIGIVKSNQGGVTVTSELGVGATFRVALPLIPSHQSACAARAAAGATILVIDEDEEIRTMLRSGLERAGMHVITASNGRQGIEVFRQHGEELSAIFLDVNLPRKSGLPTYHELRRLGALIPILVMTSTSQAESLLNVVHGARLVQKPFSIETAMESLEDAFV